MTFSAPVRSSLLLGVPAPPRRPAASLAALAGGTWSALGAARPAQDVGRCGLLMCEREAARGERFEGGAGSHTELRCQFVGVKQHSRL